MKMCLVISKKGHLRFRCPVHQRNNNRDVVKPGLITSAVFILSSVTLSYTGEAGTWWGLLFLSMLGLASALWWLIVFFPLPLKSEKAERMLASCLTSDHLDQVEAVFKDAVSSRLKRLAGDVVYLQRNDPTCDHSPKREFRQLFDAAKTLQLIGPGATYGDFFRPATDEFVVVAREDEEASPEFS